MDYIAESIQHLYQAIPTWGWAVIIAIFVFFAVLDRLGYFFALSTLVVLAWLIRDFTIHCEFDPSYQYAFTFVVIIAVGYGVYMIFTGLRRSGW